MDDRARAILCGGSIFFLVVFAYIGEIFDLNGMLLGIGGAVSYSIIAFIVLRREGTRCPKCGQTNALEQCDYNILSREDTKITEQKRIDGDFFEKEVDAVRTTREHYMKCKYCGAKVTHYSTTTTKKY